MPGLRKQVALTPEAAALKTESEAITQRFQILMDFGRKVLFYTDWWISPGWFEGYSLWPCITFQSTLPPQAFCKTLGNLRTTLL